MKRLMLAVAFAASSCATTASSKNDAPDDGAKEPQSANAANDARAEAERMVKLSRAAADTAETKCAPLRKSETPWPEERFAGEVLATQKLRANKAFDDAGSGLSRRVALVGKTLAKKSARPDLPWTFGVLVNDTPNATHAPGGYVFVTTGLLARMTNEAELAGVLAHEIAHVAAKHTLVRYRDALNKVCVAATTVAELARNGLRPGPSQLQIVEFAEKFDTAPDFGKADGGFVHFVFDAVMSTLQFGLDRDLEFDADREAAALTAFAGYDVSQYEAFLARLNGEGSSSFGMPPTADRVAKLKALREGELAPFAVGTQKADLTALVAPLKK